MQGNVGSLTFVAAGFEQLIQLAQIPAAEPIIIAHEDPQRIARGREAQGSEQRDAHVWLGTCAGRSRRFNRVKPDQSIASEAVPPFQQNHAPALIHPSSSPREPFPFPRVRT